MINISWEINAIVAAKYAWELRQPLSRIIEKLGEETDTEIASLADNVLRRTRYLAQMRRTVIQAFITARQNNKFGSSVMDRELIQFFTATVARGSTEAGNADEGLHPALIHALKELNKGGEEELVNIQDEAIPQTMLVSENSPTGYAMFNIYDSELQEEVPGITVRGTALGIGEQAASENLLVVEPTSVSNNNSGTIYFDFIDFSKTDESANDYRTDQVGDYFQNIGCYSLNDYDVNPLTLGEEAQWLRVRCPTEYSGSVVDYANDHRTVSYAFCEFFATLEPGEYKVVIEGINLVNRGIDYWDTTYNGPYSKQNKPGWFALVDSNNNQIIPKTCMLQSNTIVPYSDIYYDSDFPIANLYFDLSKYGPDPSSSWGSYWDGTRYWLRTGFNGSAWEEMSTFFNHTIYYKSSRWGGLANEVYYPRGVYSYSIWVKTDTSGGESAEIYITEHENAYYYNTERGIAKDVSTDLNHKTIQLTTTWTLVSVTFEVTTAGYLTIRVEKTVENGNNIYVTCPVVVKGSKPHSPVRYDRFVHEEYPFTLTERKQVGLMHVLYQGGADFVTSAPLTMPRAVVYTRFMICRADLDSDPFAFAYNYPGTSYSADFSGWTNFQPSGGVGGATLTAQFTNLLNLKTYNKTISIPHKLLDNETVDFFTTTAEQEAMAEALKDSGLNPAPLGLIKVDILDKDANNQGAHITTHYRR